MLWRCWLGGRKGIWPVKTEWWGAGVVVSLKWGADLHIARLMPRPLTVSRFSKIQIGFTFLVPAYPGSPGKRAVKWVCVSHSVSHVRHVWKELGWNISSKLGTLTTAWRWSGACDAGCDEDDGCCWCCCCWEAAIAEGVGGVSADAASSFDHPERSIMLAFSSSLDTTSNSFNIKMPGRQTDIYIQKYIMHDTDNNNNPKPTYSNATTNWTEPAQVNITNLSCLILDWYQIHNFHSSD